MPLVILPMTELLHPLATARQRPAVEYLAVVERSGRLGNRHVDFGVRNRHLRTAA